MKKSWLIAVYIGDYTTQLDGNYNKPVYGSLLTNGFFGGSSVSKKHISPQTRWKNVAIRFLAENGFWFCKPRRYVQKFGVPAPTALGGWGSLYKVDGYFVAFGMVKVKRDDLMWVLRRNMRTYILSFYFRKKSIRLERYQSAISR